ncbi:hypothetical protein ONZ45_g19673 [Pleurotus djamor]|nr:hypothetical protein ONZ45_g19673 [Pleurotus djamor]
MQLFARFIPLVALALHVNAHGVITAVTGTNGVTGQGFGVDASTPRDGSRRNPFQQDTSIIRDREIAQGTAGVCGRTLGGGNNDVQAQMTAASAAGLPSAAADGTVTMTLHQVNGDGAGPYTCQVSADGTGQDFVQMTVTQNVPGVASLSLAKAKDIPLVAQMPAGMACTGGPNGDACLVRCRNSAIAGPFGSCVAVTSANSGNAAAAAGTATNVTATGVAPANGAAASGLNGGVTLNGNANGQPAVGQNGGVAVNTNANGQDAVGQNGGVAVNGNANGAAASGQNGGCQR